MGVMSSATSTAAARWRRADDVAEVTSTPERYAVLPLGSDAQVPYLLTGTAAAIWAESSGGASTEGIVAALAERYSTAPNEICEQVSAFLRELEACHLLIADTQPR